MLPLALVGNLSLDLIDGGPPRTGGAPFHCARALRLLGTRATIVARCAPRDAATFRRGFARLGLPATIVPGTYRLTFDLATYHRATGVSASFFPEARIAFNVRDTDEHYHVPLLVSPFGYSTYRGA